MNESELPAGAVANPAYRPLPQMFYNVEALPALFAALAAAQAEYAPVVRDKLVVQKLKNKATGEYTGGTIKFLYAELVSILDATRPALSKNGLTFLQPLDADADGKWFVNSILAHANGAMIICRTEVWPAADQKQFGGNITYVRRYTAGPMLGVSAEDDADENGEPAGDGWEQAPQEGQRRAAPARKAEQAAQQQPQYGADLFAKNLPAWAKLIAEGKKTADQIIATVQTKHTLSAEQVAAIRAPAKPKVDGDGVIDDDFVAGMERGEAAQNQGSDA